ncbi:hypothetical protein C2G38_2154945 [Gigaspora rosea]|uniref:Uncharacterized protein n=1 Tax=Gigaspora rosea TaxID=44941 RepID=A0A397W4E2_9GLOM|nr:hypothetical protein C2G38_2154945 [Gigaspora rosea]
MWTDDQLSLLIAKRRNKNADYHNIPGSSRLMCQYMAGNHTGRRTRTGARYFEEFRSRFWKRPGKVYINLEHLSTFAVETQFDQIHNINVSSRQREIRRYNHTPPPSYKEISSMMSRCESTATQRDRSASPNHRVSSNRRVSTNRNNEGENFNHNSNNLVNTAPDHRSEESLLHNNASQNDSDISMPDIGGSQPPSCMENINEEN